jgi:hypothetical protein
MASNALTDSAGGFFRGGQPLTWRATCTFGNHRLTRSL